MATKVTRIVKMNVNQPVTDEDIDEINRVAALYVKWHHLFRRGGPLNYGDSSAMDLMMQPSVAAVWPHVYDVAFKAGQRNARRWVWMFMGLAAYGFGSIVVDVIKIFQHLLQ